MTHEEKRNWILFHQECPLDDLSNHHRPIAHLQATMFNIHRGRNVPSRKLTDFMLHRSERDAEQDIDDLILHGNW